MTDDSKAAFFDDLAAAWDVLEDLDTLHGRLAAGLEEFKVRPDETVLDVGCGTGNLTRALLSRLSDQGRVIAVDIAARMLEAAREKNKDPRVSWTRADAHRLPLPDASADRAICCSVWPHFDHPAKVAGELARALRPGGSLHIWHLVSRERVNCIHDSAGPIVRGDHLCPARVTAGVIERAGFEIRHTIDGEERYLVTGVRASGPR